MNPDDKIQQTLPEDYIIQYLMVKQIKIELKKVVRDTELMVLVYRELTANQQYFSTKKTTPIISC
jgi:hypothetical protein